MYLEVVLEEGDPKMIEKAFSNIIEAKGRKKILYGDRQDKSS